MNIYLEKRRTSLPYRFLSVFIAFTFIFSVITPPGYAQSMGVINHAPTILNLPPVGTMVPMTNGFTPALVKGITIHPENPLLFDFIIDSGDSGLADEALKEESRKLIKYFLASLTVPEKDLWVNLSPYEKDRVIPQGFGDTEMGRDLLAQDYILKQLTASLMYPEDELGQKFWDRVYKKAYEKFGTTEIPMNTFNKIWIVPEKAVVFEHEASAFVIESHLKVMLEEDYVALQNNLGVKKYGLNSLSDDEAGIISGITSAVVRDVLIPEIEKEVNEGATFASLRQIYNSSILATWYKQNLQDSLLGQVYVDQNKTQGVDTQDKQVNQKIYNQYVEAFKKGVYNYIREDYDPATQELIPRKYFSGGTRVSSSAIIEVKSIPKLTVLGVISLVTNEKTLRAISGQPLVKKALKQRISKMGRRDREKVHNAVISGFQVAEGESQKLRNIQNVRVALLEEVQGEERKSAKKKKADPGTSRHQAHKNRGGNASSAITEITSKELAEEAATLITFLKTHLATPYTEDKKWPEDSAEDLLIKNMIINVGVEGVSIYYRITDKTLDDLNIFSYKTDTGEYDVIDEKFYLKDDKLTFELPFGTFEIWREEGKTHLEEKVFSSGITEIIDDRAFDGTPSQQKWLDIKTLRFPAPTQEPTQESSLKELVSHVEEFAGKGSKLLSLFNEKPLGKIKEEGVPLTIDFNDSFTFVETSGKEIRAIGIPIESESVELTTFFKNAGISVSQAFPAAQKIDNKDIKMVIFENSQTGRISIVLTFDYMFADNSKWFTSIQLTEGNIDSEMDMYFHYLGIPKEELQITDDRRVKFSLIPRRAIRRLKVPAEVAFEKASATFLLAASSAVKQILVVLENKTDNGRIVKTLRSVKKPKYAVTAVKNNGLAKPHLEKTDFDLIISDKKSMRGMQGNNIPVLTLENKKDIEKKSLLDSVKNKLTVSSGVSESLEPTIKLLEKSGKVQVETRVPFDEIKKRQYDDKGLTIVTTDKGIIVHINPTKKINVIDVAGFLPDGILEKEEMQELSNLRYKFEEKIRKIALEAFEAITEPGAAMHLSTFPSPMNTVLAERFTDAYRELVDQGGGEKLDLKKEVVPILEELQLELKADETKITPEKEFKKKAVAALIDSINRASSGITVRQLGEVLDAMLEKQISVNTIDGLNIKERVDAVSIKPEGTENATQAAERAAKAKMLIMQSILLDIKIRMSQFSDYWEKIKFDDEGTLEKMIGKYLNQLVDLADRDDPFPAANINDVVEKALRLIIEEIAPAVALKKFIYHQKKMWDVDESEFVRTIFETDKDDMIEKLRSVREKTRTVYKRNMIDLVLKHGYGASSALIAGKDHTGGINLNPAQYDLQIKRDPNGVPLPVYQQPIGEIRMNINGFSPIILNMKTITPVVNLPLILGLTGDEAPLDSTEEENPQELSFVDKYRNKFYSEEQEDKG